MKNYILTILMAVAFFVANGQEKVTLTVNVEGVPSTDGKLKISVFNSEVTYLEKAFIVETIDLSTDKNRSFKITGLEPGDYAVSIIHDENNNGELDMGMMGPTEAYGFSNNARNMYGPADYSDSVMKIEEDKVVTIQIK